MANLVQDTLMSPLRDWLNQHPYLLWLAHHPWWALGFVVVGIVLLGGLVGAIARFTEQFWISLFQLPIRVFQWFFVNVFWLFRRSAAEATRSVREPTPHDRVTSILSQLDELRQEQERLIAEMRQILANSKS